MNSNKKVVALIVTLGLAAVLGACGGGTTTTPEASPTPAATPSP